MLGRKSGRTFTVPPIETVEELEDKLSEPTPALVEAIGNLDGDIIILGINGKIGPSLARMASLCIQESGRKRRFIGVDRNLAPDAAQKYQAMGIETIEADLLEPGAFDKLPDAENVLYLCAQKFGSTGAEWNTWAINVLLAGLAARRYKDSKIVAFSSGNVYPFEPVGSGGSTEATPPAPVGEYAMSCLGRERMFEHYAERAGAKVCLLRLNYAVELRYGVIHDVAAKVWKKTPIDLNMGHVNVVWQGYVCRVVLGALLAEAPPRILNITGPETVSVRWMANRLGELMGKAPVFEGEEAPTALLNNAALCHKLFGYPKLSVDALIELVAQWIMAGGQTLGKETHYDTRNGKF